MKDYRLPENRNELFTALYEVNLEHGILPGLVYRYMPALVDHFSWDDEQKLYFAFLNGLTQNPITSLHIMQEFPDIPDKWAMPNFEKWFNKNWDRLQFDTDRRYQKKDTPLAIWHYGEAVRQAGSQAEIFAKGTPYSQLWKKVFEGFYSFGRLSSFSYLEYVYIMGFGSDCDNLLFEDKSGSKSHRNGFLLLNGFDELVWDKRMENSHDGNYPNFKEMCAWINSRAEHWLLEFQQTHPGSAYQYASRFTLESNYCTFKNHFFGRRYPGVYALMAAQRIKWAMDHDVPTNITDLFVDMYRTLPDWLCDDIENSDKISIYERAGVFPAHGYPYNAEHLELS